MKILTKPQEERKGRNGVTRRVLLRNFVEAQDAGMQLGSGAALHQSFAYTRRVRATIVTWIDKY